MTVAWTPPKPRLHNRSCVRKPKAPLRNGALRYTANVLLERLQDRAPPPSLAAIIEDEHRANRSDGLESIWAVVVCLLAFTNLKSFRVGFRQRRGTGHDLVGLSVVQISRWCGLSLSTVSHVLTILRRAGYVHGPSKDKVNHINQPWERLQSGALAPLPAIRRFQFAFFAELGVGTLIARKRLGEPAPKAVTATVHPDSARNLIRALGDQHALDGPPDD
jgi:DNA-binding transcriptional ArsR family regulator